MRRRQTKVYLALEWFESGHLVGINRYACEANWMLDRWMDPVYSTKGLQCFRGHGIICQLFKGAIELVKLVGEKRLPMVELCNSVPDMRMPRVLPDEEAEGDLAAVHLLERGFTRFVFFGSKDSPSQRGFTRTIRAAGREVRFVCINDIEREIGRTPSLSMVLHDHISPKRIAWARRFFSECEKPVGVYVQNLLWAVNIVEGCRAARILVPEQVAVICRTDTSEQGVVVPVPVTVIVPDYEKQGYEAAALLDRMIQGEKVPPNQVVTIPPLALVPRMSTFCHATDNPRLTRAATFIMRNLHDPRLCVKGIFRATKVSYSTFYRDFARQFKMPIARYITHLRLKEALRLLATTDATASAIAAQCGFGNLPRFRDTLRRATRMGPAEWRQKHEVEKCTASAYRLPRGCEDAKRPDRSLPAPVPSTPPRRDCGTPQPWRGYPPPRLVPLRHADAEGVQSGVQSGMSGLILGFLTRQDLGKKAIVRKLGKLHRTRYLNDLVRRMVKDGWIEYTIPDKPNSRLQQYRLTEKGGTQLSKGLA